jgi:hypothetical protein
MFKIEEPASYTWPVEVFCPRDGGKFVKATFTAEFKTLPQQDIDRIIADLRDGNPDADFATECIAGWNGVQDADGAELAYSDEAKAKLLNIPYVRNGVVTAFFKSLNGGANRRKNS